MVYHAPMDAAEKLFAVFGATDAATGEPLYPVADLQHFLPWILVHMPVDFGALDDGTVALFAETCTKAGVVAGEGRDALVEKLDAYYEAHPPNAALVQALQTVWREVNQDGAAPNPFAKFSGDAKRTQVLDSGTRPKGTVPAGPMARFQVDPKTKK